MRSFEDLNCWKKAAELRRELSALAKKLPQEERFRLADQLVRASRSVTANIAEGFGRFHYQEYVQFCRQSRGSLYEIIDHLTVACEEKFLTEVELESFKDKIQECLAVLNGFINYLLKAKSQDKEGGIVNEPETYYYRTDN